MAERGQTMNFLYKAKWIIVVLSAIVWVMTFGVLFAGGSAFINRTFLILNLILLLAQIMNVVRAFLIGKRDIGIGLMICSSITILLLWAIYLWNWNCTVKVLTVGFE